MKKKNLTNHFDWEKAQNAIEYKFKEKKYLKHALTHSSYANEKQINKLYSNERLEFLGDAVLELVASEYVYNKYSKLPEGELTKIRASLVCEQSLAYCAREFGIGELLLLGKGENSTGGRDRDSILSDAVEAIIGGIFLDGGFTNAKEFVKENILKKIENQELFFDSKTILQEIIQSITSDKLSYKLVKEEGPDHNKEFTVAALLGDKEIGIGKGKTKKSAEQEAANKAIIKVKSKGNKIN